MLTMEGWQQENCDFMQYAKAGDEISEEVYWYFLECVPPALWVAGYFLMGEAFSSNANYETTYLAFRKNRAGKYYYIGPKTKKEIAAEIYKI